MRSVSIGEQALGLGHAGEQLLARRRQVAGVHVDLVPGRAKAVERVAGDRARDEDPGHAAGPYAQRARAPSGLL